MNEILMLQTKNFTDETIVNLIKYIGTVKKINSSPCLHDVETRFISKQVNLAYVPETKELILYSNAEITEFMDADYYINTKNNTFDFFGELTIGRYQYH